MSLLNSMQRASWVPSTLALACCVACMGCRVANAQEALDPVVVTATRVPTRINDLVADVSVIGSDQIRASAGQTLPSLLAQVPGVQFSSNGGLGKNSNLFIRGGDARHTLLLIDGARVGSATTGMPSLDNLPLDQIDRIEVVRGPLAALYGADAAAGVIQIFTRKGREGLHTNASFSAGTESYNALSAGVSGGVERFKYSVQASQQATSGFSATNARVGASSYNPDRDGFKQQSLSVNASYGLSSNWHLDGSLLRSVGLTELDDGVVANGPTLNYRSRLTTQSGSAKLTGKLSEDWQSGLRWSRSLDKRDTSVANKASNKGEIETVQTQWTWDHQIASPIGSFLLATEQIDEAADSSSTAFPVKSRSVYALVAGLSGERGGHIWQASTRRDRNSQFGSETTGSLAYGYDLTSDWRVGVSTGTSFVAPTFNQLYNPQGNYGDPTLKPEHGRNKEASLRWADGGDTVKLVYFNNHIRDFIQTVTVQGSARAAAIPEVEMRGWTWSADSTRDTVCGKWMMGGALDLLQARNGQTGKKLQQRADTTASLHTSLRQGAMTYGAYIKANDGAYGDDTNTSVKKLAGYSLLGVSVQWAFKPGWQAAVRIDNLSDKDIQTIYGYNQPRRQAMLTVSYNAP